MLKESSWYRTETLVHSHVSGKRERTLSTSFVLVGCRWLEESASELGLAADGSLTAACLKNSGCRHISVGQGILKTVLSGLV